MIEEFRLDEIMKIIDYNESQVETEESYRASKNYNLTYEDLKYMSGRFYGSHEYDRFIYNNVEYINKLKHEEKFMLMKSLYCLAKSTSLIGEILQDLVKIGGVPAEEKKLIEENFSRTVYRGYNELNLEDGFSYTTDFGVAKWFARRFECFGKKGYVTKIDVDIDDIVFYYDGRGEKEMFIKESSLSEKIMEIINID